MKYTRRGVSDETDEVERFRLLLLVAKLEDLVLAPIGRLEIDVVDDFRLGVGGSVSSRLLRNGRQFISDDVYPEVDFLSGGTDDPAAGVLVPTRKLDERPNVIVLSGAADGSGIGV